MVLPNLDPQFALAKDLSGIKTRIAKLETQDLLQNSSVSANGVIVDGGGSINVKGGGTLYVNGVDQSSYTGFWTGTQSDASGTWSDKASFTFYASSKTIQVAFSVRGTLGAGGIGSYATYAAMGVFIPGVLDEPGDSPYGTPSPVNTLPVGPVDTRTSPGTIYNFNDFTVSRFTLPSPGQYTMVMAYQGLTSSGQTANMVVTSSAATVISV